MLKKAWVWCLYKLCYGLIALRYRVRVKGLEHIQNLQGGALVLPNHPAEIDPVILMLVLGESSHIRPVVLERFYHLRWLRYCMRLTDAVPIPDFTEGSSGWKQRRIERCFRELSQGLSQGMRYLVYPSGRLKDQAEEIVGGASLVHALVQENPNVSIVLARTTGLWGSRFSRAYSGETPNPASVVRQGIGMLLKNLIFFAPRRHVLVEFEPLPERFPRREDRVTFNRALELWYNQSGPEPLNRVSELWWTTLYPKLTRGLSPAKKESRVISPAIAQEVMAKIGEIARKSSVKPSDHLGHDLGLDSLEMAELYAFLSEQYHIDPHVNVDHVHRVEDVLQLVAAASHQEEPVRELRRRWPCETGRPGVISPQGRTLQEAFLRSCDRMGGHAACADERMGVVSYRQLKRISLTLSYHFQRLPGTHVGVLLPASAITYAIIIGLMMAGKVPVMLNWTIGAKALRYCHDVSGCEQVVTSSRFLDHLGDGGVEVLEEQMVFTEEIRDAIHWWDRLRGAWASLAKTGSLLRRLPAARPHDTAMILFTSGTEALPKGVPLTHDNLLSNQRAGLLCVPLSASDVLYGHLPPFHSFGFSVTGLLPLLAGLRVFYAPDPTQYIKAGYEIEEWEATLLCSAPTFIQGILRNGTAQQRHTLRLVVGGAEKVPQELFDVVEKQGANMLEGYGITECSPIVTLSRLGRPREGVGHPIQGVDIMIVHPETLEPVTRGVEGEVCISGPNVFGGYLGDRGSPFLEYEGKRWYRSGDLGSVSPTGALIVSGRLKRFIKVGSEMISLAALEQELIDIARNHQLVSEQELGLPILAVIAHSHPASHPPVMIFSTFSFPLEVIQRGLRHSGLGRMIKILKVVQLDQIPMTGSGKVRYSALQDLS